MNTADRSLALLETALRRRFDFVPLLPDTCVVKDADDPHSAPLAGLVVTTSVGAIDVRRMLERINERIEALSAILQHGEDQLAQGKVKPVATVVKRLRQVK